MTKQRHVGVRSPYTSPEVAPVPTCSTGIHEMEQITAKLSRKSFDGDSSCQIYQTMATPSRC